MTGRLPEERKGVSSGQKEKRIQNSQQQLKFTFTKFVGRNVEATDLMAPPKPSCLAVTRGPSATETMSLLWYFFLFLLRRHQELAAVELKPLSGRHAGAFSRKTTQLNSDADGESVFNTNTKYERLNTKD